MLDFKRIGADGFIILVDGAESTEQFKQLVHRATNLWPDATPEIKELADQITNFDIMESCSVDPDKRGLQNYWHQNTSSSNRTKLIACDFCGTRYRLPNGKKHWTCTECGLKHGNGD